VTADSRVITRQFWQTRRSAAVAGIVFALLMIAALVMIEYALAEDTLASLAADPPRRTAVRIGLGLMPFAGIAFLWFIGVVRERLGDIEDRLFSTVSWAAGCSSSRCCSRAPSRPGCSSRWARPVRSTRTTLGLRTRTVPKWLGLVGYAVALVFLVSPDGQPWVAFVFPGWVLLLSITLMVLSSTDDTGRTAAAPKTPSPHRGAS
jgi:hypothetical protein